MILPKKQTIACISFITSKGSLFSIIFYVPLCVIGTGISKFMVVLVFIVNKRHKETIRICMS